MDIICATCGRHFNSIEAARDHRGKCKRAPDGGELHWIPSQKNKLTPAEWDALMKAINSQSALENHKEQARIKPDRKELKTPAHKARFRKPTPLRRNPRFTTINIPRWLLALTLIIILSLVGLAIYLWTENSIPAFLLFGFAFIYSIDRWFLYYVRRYKAVGISYRLLLNLSILSLFGLLIWSGVELFSQELNGEALPKSLIFLAEIILFIWLWRVVSKNGWRRPSMKLTFACLATIFLIFAFAGVEPMAEYKDKSLDFISSSFNKLFDEGETTIPSDSTASTTTITSVRTTTATMTSEATITTTTTAPGGTTTITTTSLSNPSWSQLLDFLKADKTDEMPYIYPTFVCDNFASILQSNAKNAGWRCAKVRLDMIDMIGRTDPYDLGIPPNAGHSCNAFETTDRGLVYIDCTGIPLGFYGPLNNDKIVTHIDIGEEYATDYIFPSAGWVDSIGWGCIVTGINIQW